MIGDEQIYSHCYKVRKIKENLGIESDNVELSIPADPPPVPNCASLLITEIVMLFHNSLSDHVDADLTC